MQEVALPTGFAAMITVDLFQDKASTPFVLDKSFEEFCDAWIVKTLSLHESAQGAILQRAAHDR